MSPSPPADGPAPSPLAPGPLAIVRPRNLVIAAAGVAVGGVLALGRLAFPAALLWAMGSAIGLGAAGNAANDLFDVEADRVNRPLRPLVTGALSRSAAVVVAGVALVASMPLIYGAQAAGDWHAGLVPAELAALLHLGREVVKDLEDVPGDLAIGRRTVPIAWGPDAGFTAAAIALFVFLPVSVLPWAAGWYGWRYGVPVLALDVYAVILIGRLLDRRVDGVRAALKLTMVIGLAALLWDRL